MKCTVLDFVFKSLVSAGFFVVGRDCVGSGLCSNSHSGNSYAYSLFVELGSHYSFDYLTGMLPILTNFSSAIIHICNFVLHC